MEHKHVFSKSHGECRCGKYARAVVVLKPMHSRDAGLEPITLKGDRPVCPNEFPHVPHTNAVFTDWQQAQSWNCNGGTA